MTSQPSFLPRPGDLPRQELVALANEAIALANEAIAKAGGSSRAEVHFKFTCMWCGERCTLCEANVLYEEGECCVCGRLTSITAGGMSLHLKL